MRKPRLSHNLPHGYPPGRQPHERTLTASLHPLPLHPIPRQREAATATACSVQGNADLYGVGIRAGIYLQALATILTNALVPDAVCDLRDTNTIFLFALFVAMLKTYGQCHIADHWGVRGQRCVPASVADAKGSGVSAQSWYRWSINRYFRLMVVRYHRCV